MAEGFGMSGGQVQAGTIFIGVKIQDVEKALAQMKGLETQAKTTGENARKSTETMAQGFKNLQAAIQMAIIAVGSLKVAWDAFVAYGKQETALNRIEAAVRRQGDVVGNLRQRMDDLGNEFIALGQREEAAWTGFQRLYQATGNVDRAMGLLSLSLKFAAAQGEDAGSVASALARAYSGQDRQLKMLLASSGLAAKSLKEFTDYEKLMGSAASDATLILSAQEQAVGRLRAEIDKLKDSLGKLLTGPGLVWAKYFTGLISGFPGSMVVTGPAETMIKAIRETIAEMRNLGREAANQKALDFWLNPPWGARPAKAARGGDGDGEFVDPYASIRQQRESLFDIMQQSGVEAAKQRAEAVKVEGDALRANYDAYMKYRAAVADWDLRNSPQFLAAVQLADLFANTLTDAIRGVKITLEDLGQSLLSILASIIGRLIELKTLTWMEGVLKYAPGTLSGMPQPVKPSGFGGVRPLAGGGTSVVIQGTTGGGILAAIYKGATLVEQRQVSKTMLLVGGRTALATS